MDSEENTSRELIKGFDSFEDFLKTGFQSVMGAIIASNKLPKGDQWDYYKTFPSFNGIMDNQATKVVDLMSIILKHQGIQQNIARRDIEEKYDLVVDTNDVILERVGIMLDELNGIQKNQNSANFEERTFSPVISGSWNVDDSDQNKEKGPRAKRFLFHSKNVEKPQIHFKDGVDNFKKYFKPQLKDKPNALKPLHESIVFINEEEGFTHPYQHEIDAFVQSLSDKDFKKMNPIKPRPLQQTPLLYVDTEKTLNILIEELRADERKELAVDVEYHSYRSFQGFTCLIQLSTRTKDYIVDTIALRDKLYILNEFFTDPSITKVLHGADFDIPWLQKDLNIYIVNMFDTRVAASKLGFNKQNLAHLLKTYCMVHADKNYQLYDWRTRPLPERALVYAREDTHYLLYIHDNLKNDLIGDGNSNVTVSTYFQSAEICKSRYIMPVYKADAYKDILKRAKKRFDNRQLTALQGLHEWRDKIARKEDESTGYTLPNHMLLQIAENLPREMQGILASCNPIPPLVRQNLYDLHEIVLKGRQEPYMESVQFVPMPTPKLPNQKSQGKKTKRNIQDQDGSNKKLKTEFRPFDYSKVDFNKFQSGPASSINRAPQEHFKARGQKKKSFKKFNQKSMSFSKNKWN
uniref:HRDC domain-containing protein n=1 Tax=Clastoptera arizonana TaxID=38151 RepID=A0A1B6DM44_9HEMI